MIFCFALLVPVNYSQKNYDNFQMQLQLLLSPVLCTSEKKTAQ